MQVEYVREDKYHLEKLQTSLFGEEKEEKVILTYRSQPYLEFIKSCVARELPILPEKEYHEFWERETQGHRFASYEFVKAKKRVHKRLLEEMEEQKRQIIQDRKEAIQRDLEGKDEELKAFQKQHPELPKEFWYSMKVSEIVQKQFLKQRSVE